MNKAEERLKRMAFEKWGEVFYFLMDKSKESYLPA
jgi:hypothetical protein